jgi:NAD(P)-dependent dehydrogenase (short-subunit alcohol dehydrogenase family)
VTTILVGGAASGIGESIVRALLARADTRVIATSRSAERLATLRTRFEGVDAERVVPMLADGADFADAERLANDVAAAGGADAAVAIFGRGWWSRGPLLELSASDWNALLHEMLGGHFAFARAIVPMLAERAGSRYLSLGGGAAFAPIPGAGVVSIAAAGQAMLTRVLARERTSDSPWIRELIVNGPVNTRESRTFAEPGWIGDDDVGRVASELVLDGTTNWPNTTANGPLLIMNPVA